MNIIKLIVLQVGLLSIWLSAVGQSKQDRFVLSATLIGFGDHTKFYLIDLDSPTQIDSAYLTDNIVKFKGRVSQPSIFRLMPESKDRSFNFWVENAIINLTGSKEKFSQLTVKGSSVNDLFRQVERRHETLDHQLDSLTRKAVNEPDEKKAIDIWKVIASLYSKTKQIRIQTIATSPPSFVTLKELFFLRNDFSRDSLKQLFDRFPSTLQQTKDGRVVAQYLKADPKVGSRFTDLTGQTLANEKIKVSDYKKRVILLDFWASWCGPCRASNKYLAELYQQYRKEGFEIISFSIDTNVNDWRKASQKDNIDWVNISDLKGYHSTQIASYRIRAIPQSYLIDRDGKIAEIFSGYDDAHKDLVSVKIEQLLRQ